MRVLIVGCGYVGMRLALELASQGHQVSGLRRSAPGQPGTETALLPIGSGEGESRGLAPGLLAADITRPAELAKISPEYDWVVNCVSSSRGGAEDYRKTYLEGTRNLIDWLSPRPPGKFVYTSSTSVYGQTDGSLVTEASPAEPATESARILLNTEKVLLEAASEFPAVILRVAGIYGPGRGHWFKQYLNNEAIIEGRGKRILNMVHRDDAAGAIIAALEGAGPGKIYNVVDDEPVTQLAYFEWLAARLAKSLPPFAAAEEAPERKRGLTSKKVSNSRLKLELGYQFKYPTFRQGYAAEIDRLNQRGPMGDDSNRPEKKSA
jgi:nucleoside-diphosphate-sugar epimerase